MFSEPAVFKSGYVIQSTTLFAHFFFALRDFFPWMQIQCRSCRNLLWEEDTLGFCFLEASTGSSWGAAFAAYKTNAITLNKTIWYISATCSSDNFVFLFPCLSLRCSLLLRFLLLFPLLLGFGCSTGRILSILVILGYLPGQKQTLRHKIRKTKMTS